jgi:alcohol dehydrogenase
MKEEHERNGRAVWFTSQRQAELITEPVSAPEDDEVLVRAKVSLVSAGSEMTVFRGQTASIDEIDLETLGGDYPFPIKFGYQVVGEVLEAGASAGFAPGDRIFSYHPHQDLFSTWTRSRRSGGFLSNAPLVFPIPDNVADRQAAFANLYAVAFNALLDVPVRYGDVVAIYGLGVVGHILADLVRPIAGQLVLIDPILSRRNRITYVNADAVVHPDDARSAIDALSSGRGTDLSFEASGAPQALQTAINLTGVEGTIAVISYFGTRDVQLRLAPEFHVRRQRIKSTWVGLIDSSLQSRWNESRRMSAIMHRLADFNTEHIVSHTLPFDSAPDAYRLIDTTPEDTLGILLEY